MRNSYSICRQRIAIAVFGIVCLVATVALAGPSTVTLSSFNIKWLGASSVRDNAGLAAVLKGYDAVVVQELVAPPYPMHYPDGAPAKPDPESAAFFDAMKAVGFDYLLSEEDTGTGDKNHTNGTATEWFAAFYKPAAVQTAPDLPHGFLTADRSNHPDYERAPYAFAFRTPNKRLDFVLISVHLKPGAEAASKARRRHELASVAAWVNAQGGPERDYIIAGDMNIENGAELDTNTPAGFASLNDELRATNVSPSRPKPYDHVMIRPQYTREIDSAFDFQVINLIQAVRPYWDAARGPFPGKPYDGKRFIQAYSDHCPVVFRLTIPAKDDD